MVNDIFFCVWRILLVFNGEGGEISEQKIINEEKGSEAVLMRLITFSYSK